MEEEVFECIKGDYKTTIVCKFNEKGYLVSHSVVSKKLIDEVMTQLKEEMEDAIEVGDVEGVKELQRRINEKRQGEERKPTL